MTMPEPPTSSSPGPPSIRRPATVAIVFYDRRNTIGDATEVTLAISQDGGATFDNNIVSDAPFTPWNSVFFGDYIGIDSWDGIIYAIWMTMDRRRPGRLDGQGIPSLGRGIRIGYGRRNRTGDEDRLHQRHPPHQDRVHDLSPCRSTAVGLRRSRPA